jgi:hypothetical protein
MFEASELQCDTAQLRVQLQVQMLQRGETCAR